MAPSRRGALGARGEAAAAQWYRDASYRVLERNWRCAEGELDVVAASASGDVIVFCEVKTRTSGAFGSPFEAVTPAKQRRLRAVAVRWLREARPADVGYGRIRFDVAAARPAPDGSIELEVMEDAF